MEVVDNHTVINATLEDDKTNIPEDFATEAADTDACHKQNGVNTEFTDEVVDEQASVQDSVSETIVVPAMETETVCEVTVGSDVIEATKTEVSKIDEVQNPPESNQTDDKEVKTDEKDIDTKVDESVSPTVVVNETDIESVDIAMDSKPEIFDSTKNENSTVILKESLNLVDEKESTTVTEVITEEVVLITEPTTVADNMELSTLEEEVHFETEVLVEENGNDVNENTIDSELTVSEERTPSTNNILSELGENIELSEVLSSSDVDNSKNNNSVPQVEVFNKEELLDILEGNNVQLTPDVPSKELDSIETKKALEHLSMLKSLRKKRASKKEMNKIKDVSLKKKLTKKETEHKPKQKQNVNVTKSNVNANTKDSIVSGKSPGTEAEKKQEVISEKCLEKESIVNVLVMDWDDDEPTDTTEKSVEESHKLIKEPDNPKDVQKVSKEEATGPPSVDSNSVDDEAIAQIKSEDEGPPRRLGRVIKKKVIFDPDNPDTFTKTKTLSKSKEQYIKEQPSPKKIKPELIQQHMKSRSPTSKLQWKKPSPRNSKQNKRLSEVDKLLMDEGAVNMIYQLTPEAPKGRKNVKTKAEFIKKIQSSTPNSKEMKFRERKKEIKYEDADAKKILSGKQRTSLCSSVMSPTVSEDFETHSADDSIIYRRHSSSSYSSSCMSPRRLSDVDGCTLQNNVKSAQVASNSSKNETPTKSEMFVVEVNTSANENIITEVINKEDCRSIREKLNSKLSQALNKRKRDSIKSDKPPKQKKLSRSIEKDLNKSELSNDFKFVSVNIEQRLAEICLQKTGMQNCIEVLKELEKALKEIDENPEISVTLLSSQCGTLCSSLDVSLLLDENSEVRTKNAYELADSVRSLLGTVSRHSKLLCCGVWGACCGVSVGVVALCDVSLASECATFSLAATAAPTLPGAAALASPHRALPHHLVNDLVIFGRRISASEALSGGLISRTLWPDRFDEQVRNIVKDIALQPTQAILLKKRLLGLAKSGDAEMKFLSCLESERDLLVEYWTSVEGQELLRTALDSA